MSDVEVTLTFPWDGHEVGEQVSVDPGMAKRLVQAGVAAYAKDAAATKKPKS